MLDFLWIARQSASLIPSRAVLIEVSWKKDGIPTS